MTLIFSKTASSVAGTAIRCEASGLINPNVPAFPRCISVETYDAANNGIESVKCAEIQGIVTDNLHFASLGWHEVQFGIASSEAAISLSFGSSSLTHISSIYVSGLLFAAHSPGTASCTNLVGSPTITPTWIASSGAVSYGGSIHLIFSPTDRVADAAAPVVCTISSFSVGPQPMDASSAVRVYVYSSATNLAFYLDDVTFPAVVAGLGTNSPSVSVSDPVAGAANVSMQVRFTPEVTLRDCGSFVVSLVGNGLSCSGGCRVTFQSPTNLVLAANATISELQVVTVTLSSAYTFPAMELISLKIAGVSNPSNSQAELRSIRAAVLNSRGEVVAVSNSGVLAPYFQSVLNNATAVFSSSILEHPSSSIYANWDFSTFSVQVASKNPSIFSINFFPSTFAAIRHIAVDCSVFSNVSFSASNCTCFYRDSVVSAAVRTHESPQLIYLHLVDNLNIFSTSFVVSCSFDFFFVSAERKNGDFVTISTFTSMNQPIDTSSKVPYNDLFHGQLSNVSCSSSGASVLEKSIFSISFFPSSLHLPIKSLSVVGVEFSHFADEGSICHQRFNKFTANVTYSATSRSLFVSFSHSIAQLSHDIFECYIAGCTNPTRALNIRSASIATYDAESLPIDFGVFQLPAIFSDRALSFEIRHSTLAENTISTATVKFTMSQSMANWNISSIILNSILFSGVSEGFTLCSNMDPTSATAVSSANRITMFFNRTASILNASAPVECVIADVVNAPYFGSNEATVTLETYDSDMNPLHYISATTFGITCKPGYFALNGACQHCSAGTYCVSNCSNHFPCTLCPAGFFSTIASPNCSPCPAGSHASLSGQSQCEICPAGSTSAVGSSSCIHASAFYSVSSWSSSNYNTLMDLSPFGGLHAYITGSNLSIVSSADGMPYLSGNTGTKVHFPSLWISSNFTLVYVARYDGPTMRSILHSCSSSSWVSAFYQGKAGVSLRPNCGVISSSGNARATDWVVVTEQRAAVRTNGVLQSTADVSDCFLELQESLCINFDENQSSDFAIQSLMWFNATLSIDEILALEAALMKQSSPWTPSTLQVILITFLYLLCRIVKNAAVFIFNLHINCICSVFFLFTF
jgi:hypothetical protein